MEAGHVVRYADCNGSDLAYLDQRLPGHEREIVNVIGMNVTENTDDPMLEPKLGSAHGFSLVYNKAHPGSGSGPAFHVHQTEEVFVPMKGTWEVVWLEGDDERAIALEPLDVVSVPTGIYRGFRCIVRRARCADARNCRWTGCRQGLLAPQRHRRRAGHRPGSR